MDYLRYLIVAGLALDAVGFWLVVRYGHVLFTHIGTRPPSDDMGLDGHTYSIVDVPGTALASYDRRRRIAHAGVWLVLLGFALQATGFFF